MLLNLQIDTCYSIITLISRPVAGAAAAISILLLQYSHTNCYNALTLAAAW